LKIETTHIFLGQTTWMDCPQKTHPKTIYRVLKIIRYQTDNNFDPRNPTTVYERQSSEFGPPESSRRSVHNILCHRVYVKLSYTYEFLTILFLDRQETTRERLSDIMSNDVQYIIIEDIKKKNNSWYLWNYCNRVCNNPRASDSSMYFSKKKSPYTINCTTYRIAEDCGFFTICVRKVIAIRRASNGINIFFF